MLISVLVLGLVCVRAAYLPPAPLLSTRRHAAASPRGGLLHLAEAETVVSPFTEGEGDAAPGEMLELTIENVDLVLDEMRPYLLADGGNVAIRSIDGGIIELELQGACGSCPSSSMTMKMGLERGLREKFADIVDVVQVAPDGPVVRCHPTPRTRRTPRPAPPPLRRLTHRLWCRSSTRRASRRCSSRSDHSSPWCLPAALESPPTRVTLASASRHSPSYLLIWQAGGEVELISLEPNGLQPTACLKISGSGATINSVRVEIAQRLKRNFPTLANVTWD